MKKRLFLSVVMATGLCAAWSRAQWPALRTALDDDSPLEVSADRHQIDPHTGVWICDGQVRVSNARHTLRADHARVNMRTGEVEARGNVELTRPGVARWVGEKIAYNFKTGVGLAVASTLRAGRLTLQAERSQREADGRITLWDVEATTCTNAPGRRHYAITGERVTYVEDQYLSGWGGVLWLYGLPVAYMPYWHYLLDDRYGIDLHPGYTSDWGPFLLSAYGYPLLASPGGAYLDGRARADYRALRGWAFGHAFDWNLNARGAGHLDLYYLADRDGPDADPLAIPPAKTIDDRGRIAVTHTADLTPRDRVVIQGEWVSDEFLREEFFQSRHRHSPQPENQAAYTRREDHWAAGVTIGGPLNDFYDGVSRAPEGWFNLMPREILPGVYYECQSRAGYLRKRTGTRLFMPGAEYDAIRMDTAHRLSAPLRPGDLVRVTPRAVYRGTFYSDAWNEENNQFRNLFELGAETSIKGYGSFGDLRHVVEPYLDYSYLPGIRDLEYGETYSFDRYDIAQEWRDLFGFDGLTAPREWHGFRVGTRNTLQLRGEQGTRTLFDTDLYGAYSLGDPAGWQLAGWNLASHPSRDLRINLGGDYDTRERELRRTEAWLRWTAARWHISTGYLFRREPPNFAAMEPAFRSLPIPDDRASVLITELRRALGISWTVGINTRSDFHQSGLQEIGALAQYSVDCIAVQVRATYQPTATLEDGSRRDADFKVAVTVRLLTDQEVPSRDDLLGW